MSQFATKKFKVWLLVAAFFAAHLILPGLAHAAPEQEQTSLSAWKEIYTNAGDCKISFPSLPQMIQQNLKANEEGKRLTYDVYLAPYQDRGICLLLVAQYPSVLPKGHEVIGLQGLLKGIVGQHPENKLVFAEMIQLQGHPALNFLVQSGKNYFRGQAVMVGNKLYMIAMEGRKQHFEEPTFQHFLKSFQLILP